MPLILDPNPLLQSVKFQNTSYEPPTTQGGDSQPTAYTDSNKLILRDTNGVHIPMVVGADGAGVVSVALADSPYDALETDNVFAVDTTDGAVTVKGPSAGGYYVGQPLTFLDAKTKFGTHAFTFDGNGQTINGSATVVLSTDNASLYLRWSGVEWSIVASSAGAATPFNPHAPGPIGDVTPSTVKVTYAQLSTQVEPTPVSGVVQLFAGDSDTFDAQFGGGAVLIEQNLSATSAAQTRRKIGTVSLADDAFVDVTLTAGGHGIVTAAGATSSVHGLFNYAANGATSLGGATYTNFDVADTDTKLCAFASGGKLRIRNRLGSTQTVVIDLTEASSA